MAFVLDADTHICEPAAMWDYLPKEFYPRRPVMAMLPSDTLYGGRNAVWIIDGNIFPKPAGKGGFSFTHDKIRESLYIEVSTSRRRRLHEMIGRIQEALYRQNDPSPAPAHQGYPAH